MFHGLPKGLPKGLPRGNESHSESLCLYRRAFKPGGGGRNLGCAWLREKLDRPHRNGTFDSENTRRDITSHSTLLNELCSVNWTSVPMVQDLTQYTSCKQAVHKPYIVQVPPRWSFCPSAWGRPCHRFQEFLPDSICLRVFTRAWNPWPPITFDLIWSTYIIIICHLLLYLLSIYLYYLYCSNLFVFNLEGMCTSKAADRQSGFDFPVRRPCLGSHGTTRCTRCTATERTEARIDSDWFDIS